MSSQRSQNLAAHFPKSPDDFSRERDTRPRRATGCFLLSLLAATVLIVAAVVLGVWLTTPKSPPGVATTSTSLMIDTTNGPLPGGGFMDTAGGIAQQNTPGDAAPTAPIINDPNGPATLEQKNYLPLVSTHVWPDKAKFLNLVAAIEATCRPDDDHLGEDNNGCYFLQCRGFAPSRLENGVNVGSAEFGFRNGLKWPQGYAQHYIGKWNVMPTERFFGFVLAQTSSSVPPPPEFMRPSPFGEAEGYWGHGV